MPVIGLLSGFSPAGGAQNREAFRQGLSNTGFVEHQNIGIEYRWAEGRYDRLPELAADLARRRVTVIAASAISAAFAAKAATATTPIVFVMAEDPVGRALVATLSAGRQSDWY